MDLISKIEKARKEFYDEYVTTSNKYERNESLDISKKLTEYLPVLGMALNRLGFINPDVRKAVFRGKEYGSVFGSAQSVYEGYLAKLNNITANENGTYLCISQNHGITRDEIQQCMRVLTAYQKFVQNDY